MRRATKGGASPSRRRRRVRQLRLAARLHLRHLPETARRGVRVVARGGVGGVRHRGHDGGRVFASARLSARSRQPAADYRSMHGGLRLRLRVAGAAHAGHLASVRRVRRHGHRRQRHRADGVQPRPSRAGSGAAGHGAGGRDVGRRDRRDGAAAGRGGADSERGLARRLRDPRAAWSSSIGVPAVAGFIRERPSDLHGMPRGRTRRPRRNGPRGPRIARRSGSWWPCSSLLGRPERRAHAPGRRCSRTAACPRRRRDGAVGHGRREPRRPAS